MKKRTYSLILFTMFCALFLLRSAPITLKADMGPKESVHIQFENMNDELCYATLLSESKSIGPHSVWKGTYEDRRIKEEYPYSNYLDYAIWEAFVEYEDHDSFYFLQEGFKVSETKEIAWTNYPPSRFKILLYYPETGIFVSSDIYERYAFDSYYTVDMEGFDTASIKHNEDLSTSERIVAYRSYNYSQEILSLFIRILLTIVIEMLTAILFGFRQKKQLLILTLVNVSTQIILNVALNLINYNLGQLVFVVSYVLLEIIVFIIEAFVYAKFLKKISKHKGNWYYVIYSLVANALSFITGLFLARILPGIF